jgi:hypothetical protein
MSRACVRQVSPAHTFVIARQEQKLRDGYFLHFSQPRLSFRSDAAPCEIFLSKRHNCGRILGKGVIGRARPGVVRRAQLCAQALASQCQTTGNTKRGASPFPLWAYVSSLLPTGTCGYLVITIQDTPFYFPSTRFGYISIKYQEACYESFDFRFIDCAIN